MIGRTTQPIVTGGSVVALKFKGGVVIACDTMLSYGGTLKYKDVSRIDELEPDLYVAASG
jgi:20S proteasome subunit beta 7